MAGNGLSKSKFTKGIQCPKMLWMDAHMRDKFDESVMNQAVLDTGSRVGDVAMGYYGDFVEVPYDRLAYSEMIALTKELLDAETPIICEATFSFDGNLCMVDILRVELDGVHIVEVKSSTHINDIYYHDMAYQTWVLSHCGLNIKSVSLMHLNNQYVRQGKLDLQQLFTVEDCTEEVFAMLGDVDEMIPYLKDYASRDDEPEFDIGAQCKNPYECGYRGWCWRHVPKPSVFDLNRMPIKKALGYYEDGIESIGDVVKAGIRLNSRQHVQAEAESMGLDEIIDKAAVSTFLDDLSFPLYFLDFETFQPAIPIFDGTKPYQQVPTQYSLHVLQSPDAELEHYEFLAEAGVDPRRAVAEHLVADIPPGVCTLAYNMGFEKGRISELASAFPDLADRLLAINEGMRDLIVPFRNGDYYVLAMGGSNSIKAVLPALFPNDPELDYHSLEGVHNGSEAMDAFARLDELPPDEAARIREQLLHYCELDTLAMVRIWEKLMGGCQRIGRDSRAGGEVMTAMEEQNGQVECDWRYTCKSLKEDYEAAIERIKKKGPIKEEDGIAIAMGHALDLIEIAGDMPNSPVDLDLVPPTHEDSMMEIMGFAALLFQDRGSDAVRAKLAKMLASYELFVTMNALTACEIETEYQVDESSTIIRAIDSSGQKLKFDFLSRAKFAMSRCIIPDRGEMPNTAITLAPFYRKLREDFVLPLLTNGDDENGGNNLQKA